ncbi:hypothetical protein [Streptomyces sp. RKAG293]|uniref:hypothetical protein n=1 Tax=Streptomyces sp. RKAG293 TaxID=2893403 RepID=UPI0020336F1C|nr:hypothetical protein [Streptomyces sp. RKAG293]MCM2420304.1 hypothetical protein [Streptomyces sp. RKAG293]
MTQRARLRFNGQAATSAIRAGAARGLLLGAEHVLQVSRGRVPIEEGTLERSGSTSVDEQQLTAAVAYDTPYAVRVHEDLTARHDQGRQAKYLESAATQQGHAVAELLAAAVRRALR